MRLNALISTRVRGPLKQQNGSRHAATPWTISICIPKLYMGKAMYADMVFALVA